LGLKTNAKLYANGTPVKRRCRDLWCSQAFSLTKSLSQRAAIDVLQLATNRYASGNSGHPDTAWFKHRRNVMRSRLTFVGVVCRENDLSNHTISGSRQQTIKIKLTGPDSIQRRNLAHQYIVKPMISECLLHHVHINRRFNNTEQGLIPTRRGTALTKLGFSKGIAAQTVAHRAQRMLYGIAKTRSPLAIMLHQVIRQTLG
jgi:hypothetical protein